MRSRSRWLGTALSLALIGGPGAAAADEARALGHDAALRLAAERNAQLLIASLERAQKSAAADQARRDYLPQLTIVAAAKEITQKPENVTNMTPPKQSAVETSGVLSYKSPYGQAVTVSGAFTQGIAPPREAGRSLTIDVSQAILRDGIVTGAAADLKQADLDAKIAREQYRSQLNQLLRQTDRAYWELAFAREDVGIRRRSRDRARAQFEETRENIRRGLLAPGEIYVVEENVVNFDDSLVRAEESLALAESALKRLLNLPPSASISATSPIEAPPPDEAPEAESLEAAAVKSPDVHAARLRAERAGAVVDGDMRRSLPQLDVFGSFGIASGYAYDLLVTVPGEMQIRGGLRLSLPLYWGPDAARVRRARAEQSQRRAEVADAENAAVTAVRDASIRIRARRQRVELTAKLVDLAQKKLDNEREKYKSGLSTLADVVRFQRDLDTAMSGAIRARVDLLTARAELHAARGDLHDAVEVRVEMTPLIQLAQITKVYRAGEVSVPVLGGVDLEIHAGDYLALMGRSGSGKSTLMHILGLLDQPTSGSYRFEGRETAHLGDDERSRLRGQTIGFVFQRFHLIPNLDILANVELPMRYQHVRRSMWRERAAELLDRVGLGHRLHHKPNQLSGGEQQRVAIARALVNRPRLLLADEPTGNLDTSAHARVMDLFGALRAELGLTVVLVTHDPAVGRAAERCVEVVEGRCQPRGERAVA